MHVACIIVLKGYAKYKKIKNDHITVPIAEHDTGAHVGMIKKVRLTIKLTKSENFDDLIEKEDQKDKGTQSMIVDVTASSKNEKTLDFDHDDLVLKTKDENMQELTKDLANQNFEEEEFFKYESDADYDDDEEEEQKDKVGTLDSTLNLEGANPE